MTKMGKSRNTEALRLALRVEGNTWMAYIAAVGTMDGAMPIGSITMAAAGTDPGIKQAFMALMTRTMKKLLADQGITAGDFEIRPAPEHERAGRA